MVGETLFQWIESGLKEHLTAVCLVFCNKVKRSWVLVSGNVFKRLWKTVEKAYMCLLGVVSTVCPLHFSCLTYHWIKSDLWRVTCSDCWGLFLIEARGTEEPEELKQELFVPAASKEPREQWRRLRLLFRFSLNFGTLLETSVSTTGDRLSDPGRIGSSGRKSGVSRWLESLSEYDVTWSDYEFGSSGFKYVLLMID